MINICVNYVILTELPDFIGGSCMCENDSGCLRLDKGPWRTLKTSTMNFREEAEYVEKTVATSNVTRQPVGENQPQMVTCGCAAGVAAAFRVPLSGVLFALEEVTSW
ncbi:phosphatidylinositol/phosphatidylcholine transfer protein SFH3-like [Capsicum chacoense]